MIETIIKYVVLLLAAAGLWFVLSVPALIKLLTVLLIGLVLKITLFDYVDFYQVYKKARETATGAGMLFLGISIILSAIIISGV